jgi:Telomere resolvase
MTDRTVSLSREMIIDRFRQRIVAAERTRLNKSELADLIADFIDRLMTLKTKAKIQAWCTAEIALLEEGYPQATIGKVYLPMYRKAIQTAIDDGLLPLTAATSRSYTYAKRNSTEIGQATDHLALDFLKYDAATYSQFAGVSAERNNLKQDNLQPVNPDAFLAIAAELLQSADPFDLAVGIAATTGRRFTEVVAKGTLAATNDLYWISFAGQLKKREKADSYLTPCLLPAAQVLDALERFRQHPRIAMLAAGTPDQINRSLADSVKRSVIRNFEESGIVQVLPGESAVTIHNLRGIYGEICTHYFCPPDRAISRFVQERLGHVISPDELKRANSSATQHYFHYYLVDRNGQHIGSKGIKLQAGQAMPVANDITVQLCCTEGNPPTEPVQMELLSLTNSPKIDHDNSGMAAQFATLQQQVQLLWQKIESPTPTNNDELIQLRDQCAQLNTELATAHTKISQLEQKSAQLRQANLAYEQRIAQFTAVLQAPTTKEIKTPKPLQIKTKRTPQVLTEDPIKPIKRPPAAVKIVAAIAAIKQWNSQNDQKFAISQTLLLKVTGCNLPAIKKVLSEQASEIDQYHHKFGIEPRHQSKKIDLILEFLANQ